MEQDCPLIFYNIWAFLSRQEFGCGTLDELHSITTGHHDSGAI